MCLVEKTRAHLHGFESACNNSKMTVVRRCRIRYRHEVHERFRRELNIYVMRWMRESSISKSRSKRGGHFRAPERRKFYTSHDGINFFTHIARIIARGVYQQFTKVVGIKVLHIEVAGASSQTFKISLLLYSNIRCVYWVALCCSIYPHYKPYK